MPRVVRSHDVVGLHSARGEHLSASVEFKVLRGGWAHRGGKLLLAGAKNVLSAMGKTSAGGGPGFHSVGLVGLASVEALSSAARLDCCAADARLELINLVLLVRGELVAKSACHGPAPSALALVGVQGERVLSVHLAVHRLARLLKVVITNGQVTKDRAAAMLARLLLSTKVLLSGRVARGELRLHHFLIVRIVDGRVLCRNALMLHAADDAHRFAQRRRRLGFVMLL